MNACVLRSWRERNVNQLDKVTDRAETKSITLQSHYAEYNTAIAYLQLQYSTGWVKLKLNPYQSLSSSRFVDSTHTAGASINNVTTTTERKMTTKANFFVVSSISISLSDCLVYLHSNGIKKSPIRSVDALPLLLCLNKSFEWPQYC